MDEFVANGAPEVFTCVFESAAVMTKKSYPFREGGVLRAAVAYLLFVVLLLLWPFDFWRAFERSENGARWLEDSNGVDIGEPGQILSPAGTPLRDLLASGGGFTLEAWVATADPQQSGPARIVSHSRNPSRRNFTLGQEGKNLIMRLRTTGTDLNGTIPHLVVKEVFQSTEPRHIVATYDFNEEVIYVDGEEQIRSQGVKGTFSNWDRSYPLVLANEATGDRPWLGRIFLVALYQRALDTKEIHRNYQAGWMAAPNGEESLLRVSDGLAALYLFDEREGGIIADRSGHPLSSNLYIPKRIQQKSPAHFLEYPVRLSDLTVTMLIDGVLNIILFIPVGFLLHAALGERLGSRKAKVVWVMLIGGLFSLTAESLQYFLPGRFSSASDLLTNLAGTFVGIIIDRSRPTVEKKVGEESCLEAQCRS